MFIVDSPITSLKRFRNASKLRLLWLKALAERKFTDNEFYKFHCNICGNHAISPLSEVKHRENLSCFSCGSNKRFRSIIATLSIELYGEIFPLPEFPKSKEIVGIGLSDAEVYARGLIDVFSYKNTCYHKEPMLDITLIQKDLEGTADFIIASDVFEHISPPANIAFDNVFRILKNQGIFIFSVPYVNTGCTREHYPELFDYEIVTENGKSVLINRTQQGKVQQFENLKFHGGSGATLEMRVYSIYSLIRDIEKARFTEIKIHEKSIPEFGILNEVNGSSFIISMRKRLASH